MHTCSRSGKFSLFIFWFFWRNYFSNIFYVVCGFVCAELSSLAGCCHVMTSSIDYSPAVSSGCSCHIMEKSRMAPRRVCMLDEVEVDCIWTVDNGFNCTCNTQAQPTKCTGNKHITEAFWCNALLIACHSHNIGQIFGASLGVNNSLAVLFQLTENARTDLTWD